MIRAAYSRRGMTLAELMVAMGMVAIVIVMIVSFVMLMTGHTQKNGDKLTFQQDFALVKAGVEGWLEGVLREGLDQDGQVEDTGWYSEIYHTDLYGQHVSLKFENNALTAGDNTFRTESITSVTFQLVKEHGDYMIFCKVTGPDDITYTFCVNPRAGESYETNP